MSNQVALVLDEKITEEIKSLTKGMPVWIIQTQGNAEFIDRLRQTSGASNSVTTFPSKGESKADLAERNIRKSILMTRCSCLG
jgi:hypothetical protein